MIVARPMSRMPRVSTGSVLLFALILAALSFGHSVFVPLALALLLSVALSPAVAGLERIGLPRIPAVLLVMLLALAIIAAFALLLFAQVIALAEELPRYEATLRERLRVLTEGSGPLDRAWETLRHLGEELSARERGALPRPSGETAARTVAAPPASPLATLIAAAAVMLGPIATFAIALLLMAYLLLGREDVRDRFLRLVGTQDLHRTTRALADATHRVGRYLLMTLLINASFGLGMGAGLMLIGIPSAPLWGLLCFVLRFVPFLGAPFSLLFPLFMAFATGTGWTEPMLVIGLFLVVDGVITYVMEPLLYGGSTGISPLALLLSSALWTVLWGPIGLVLAPAITACLVIIGRHVPGFEFLEVMLGNVEPLEPEVRFYQRLLAGDARGAEDVAESVLGEGDLRDVMRSLVYPTLETLLKDRRAGMMAEGTTAPIAEMIEALVQELDDTADRPDGTPEIATVGVAGPLDQAMATATAAFLRGAGHAARVLSAGERPEKPYRLVVLCMVEPPSALRQRRALGHVTTAAHRVVAFVLGDAPAERLAPLGKSDVHRSADALAAALGPVPPRMPQDAGRPIADVPQAARA